MNPHKGTPVYIRDLKDGLRLDIEQQVMKSGNDELIAQLESGGDICIGHYLSTKEYYAD